jgi:hypothetical protein
VTDNHDAIGPMGQAFLATQRAQEKSGLSVAELAALDLDEYARLVYGQTPAQAALQAIEKQAQADAEPRSSAPAGDSPASNYVAPASLSEGITYEEFLIWRNQRGNQGEGQGLFSGLGGSGSAEYRDAAARHTGRTAFGREQHHPGIARQFRKDDIPATGRRQFYAG